MDTWIITASPLRVNVQPFKNCSIFYYESHLLSLLLLDKALSLCPIVWRKVPTHQVVDFFFFADFVVPFAGKKGLRSNDSVWDHWPFLHF